MANRIVGNVIIVDSAMGNAFILSSANAPVHLSNLKVNGIAFWSSDTTGACQISATDTTNVIVRFSRTSVNESASQWTSFGDMQYLEALKIPVLTLGTAWIYLA